MTDRAMEVSPYDGLDPVVIDHIGGKYPAAWGALYAGPSNKCFRINQGAGDFYACDTELDVAEATLLRDLLNKWLEGQ